MKSLPPYNTAQWANYPGEHHLSELRIATNNTYNSCRGLDGTFFCLGIIQPVDQLLQYFLDDARLGSL